MLLEELIRVGERFSKKDLMVAFMSLAKHMDEFVGQFRYEWEDLAQQVAWSEGRSDVDELDRVVALIQAALDWDKFAQDSE